MNGLINITVIMLTHNEEIHIERCIRSLLPVASKIFIIDSFSTDRTVEIAESLGAVVAQRKWKNYADQFQWGIDHYVEYCGGETDWVMRMDSDEYLELKLQHEIATSLPKVKADIDGVYLNRKQFFYDSWIRFGGRYPLTLLRLWRSGRARIEQRWMDEHIVLNEGAKTVIFDHNLVDDNLKGVTFFISKHNSYATREAIDILNNKYDLFEKDESIKNKNESQAKRKRLIKDLLYANFPLGLRSAFYFIFRYFFQLGFLDGWKGFVYHFMQGFWYRLLVDVKVYEIERSCNGDISKIKRLLRKEHGIDLI